LAASILAPTTASGWPEDRCLGPCRSSLVRSAWLTAGVEGLELALERDAAVRRLDQFLHLLPVDGRRLEVEGQPARRAVVGRRVEAGILDQCRSLVVVRPEDNAVGAVLGAGE